MTSNQLSIDEGEKQGVSRVDQILLLEDDDEPTPVTNNQNAEKKVEIFDEIEPITKHTLVTSPWSRLGMIGIPLGGGFLVFFLLINSLINGGNKSDIKIAKPEKSNQQTQQALSDNNDGDVYAQLALSKQAEELDKIDSQKKSPEKIEKTPQQPAKTFSEVPVQRQPVTVASTPMAPRSVQRTYSNQQSRPLPAVTQQRNYSTATDSPQSVAPSTSLQVTDPTDELNRLRSLGSFGEIAYTNISEDNISSSDNQTIPSDTEDSNSSTPTQPIMVTRQQQRQNPTMPVDEGLQPNQNIEVPNNNIEKITPRWLSSKSEKPTLVASSYLPQENQILSEYPTRYLMVGEYANGVMVTPAIKQESNSRNPQQQSSDNKRFVAKTTEDLHDNYGNIAIPSGTLLAIQMVSVDGGSYATVEVTSIIKDNTEYPISAGAISVLGVGGKPLIAKKFQDKGGEIAQYDLTLGLVSGLGKIGETLNESDTTTIINSSSSSYSSSSSSSSRRDIGGAFLEGAFGTLSNIIGKRTETANNEIAARPNVWYIAKDTPITFMVNRTMELP